MKLHHLYRCFRAQKPFFSILLGMVICSSALFGDSSSPPLKKLTLIIKPNKQTSELVDTQLMAIPGSEKKLKKTLNRFVGQPLDKDLLQLIRKAIYQFYSDNGRPIVLVKFHEQDITNGVLKVYIAETRLGEVRAIGNRYFKSSMLKKAISINPKDSLDMPRLSEDLSWINRNTFLQSDMVFTPGSKPGTTDIELVTVDRRPWRLFVGADNTGIPNSNPYRIFSGFNVGNLFGNQMFTYQFTTAPDYDKFYAHTAYYTIPLPCRHILIFYGGYSHVHAHIPGELRTKGSSSQASMRYEIPLPASVRVAHEFIIGYDYKRLNSDLFFTEIPIFGKTAQITQYVLGYNFGFKGDWFKTSLTIEFYASPYMWIAGQSKSDYQSLRPLAKPQYYYARAAFAPIFGLPKGFTIQPTLRGQGSTQNLLPSEEFGIGGYSQDTCKVIS